MYVLKGTYLPANASPFLMCVCVCSCFFTFVSGGRRRWLRESSLQKVVAHHTRDTLHTKLAEVYTLNKQYDDALESFHFAIRFVCR